MAIPTLPGFKRRRRGAGQEVNDFVKAFLATRKSFADSALAEKRGKLYDAQIARYEEMNAASKERRERVGKGGSGGITQEQMDQHIKNSLAPKAPSGDGARAPEGRTAVNEDGGYSPPLDPAAASRARGIEAIPQQQQAPAQQPPVVEPPSVPREINPTLGEPEPRRRAGLLIEDEQNNRPTELASYDNAPQQDTFNNFEPAYYDAVQYSAEGGMIQDNGQMAPLGEALDAALKSVQSSYGLDQRGTAVDDGSNASNLEAFARNEGAMPEETMTDLLMTVDPNSKDKIAAVLQKVYGFHTGNGDRAAAAEAVGSILQAARQESMDLGAIAMAAIEQRDFMAAGEALIDAYNKVPDGRYVEGNVDERGVGEALIRDAQTDKVVQRMPLNPQTLQMAAKRFQSGADYYNHLAQFARPVQAPRQRVALAYEGGPIEDEPDTMSAIDEADREDERLVEDLSLNEDEAQAAPVAPQQEAPEAGEADLPYSGNGQFVEGRLPEQPIPERNYVPYLPGMNATQRRQIDLANGRLKERYNQRDALAKEQRARQEARDREERGRRDADLRTVYTQNRADQRSAASAAQARDLDKIRAERAAAIAEENLRQRDSAYVLRRNLEPLDEQERVQREREGTLEREASRMSLSGEDYQASPIAARTGMRREKDVEMPARSQARDYERLNMTTRAMPKYEGGDRDVIKTELESYARTVEPDKYGYVDPKKAIDLKVLDAQLGSRFVSRMQDVAYKITEGNRLSEGRAAETAFDAIMKQDVAPRATRSDQGWRVTVGNRTVFMDGDTFHELGLLRLQRRGQLDKVTKEKVAKDTAEREDEGATLARRRQEIDDTRAYVDAFGRQTTGFRRRQEIEDERARREAEALSRAPAPSQFQPYRSRLRSRLAIPE